MLSRVAVASARRAASCISRRTALASSTVARAAPAVAGTRFASTIPELLDESVDRIPLKDAFRCVHQKTRWTYDELVKYTDAYACGLHEAGFRRGDSLALWLGDDAENVCLTLAAARLGVAVENIDPDVSDIRLVESVLERSSARALVFAVRLGGNDRLRSVKEMCGGEEYLSAWGRGREKEGHWLEASRFPSLRAVIQTGHDHEDGIWNLSHIPVYDPMPSPLPALTAAVRAEDRALSFHTSTTGGQHVVTTELTHGQVVKGAEEAAKALSLSPEDSLLVGTRMHDPNALVSMAACFTTSAQAVVATLEPDAAATQAALEVERCTAVSGPGKFERL